MLLVVGVVWKVNGRPQTSTPVEPKLVGGIELKIGGINYLGGLTKGGDDSNLQPPGGRLGDRVKYTLLGTFFYKFFYLLSSPCAQVARRAKPPRLVF